MIFFRVFGEQCRTEHIIDNIKRCRRRTRKNALVPEIVGESPPMLELFEIIERLADTDTNVLITGESGTGKEVVRGAIHRRSRRGKGNFQVIDCTAVPGTLFESILLVMQRARLLAL